MKHEDWGLLVEAPPGHRPDLADMPEEQSSTS